MRRVLVVTLFLVAASAPAAHALGPSVGLGAFGGASIPIVQEDARAGTQFGVRVPVGLLRLLTVEPYYAVSSLGDGEFEAGGVVYTRDGWDHTQFGVNAMLGSVTGAGIRFYPYAGIGSHRLEREGSDDVEEIGYNFGLGLGLSPMTSLSLHLRGELNMVVTGDTSRKFGNLNVGATYHILPLR